MQPTAMSTSYRVPGLVVTDHVVPVPLDHAAPRGEQLEVFAREVVTAGREDEELPRLVFLQGGPGFEGPRPLRQHTPSWLERALADYRVILLDQRGMGRSSPVGPNLADELSPRDLAERLTHYRADSIVRDAERVREHLGAERWSVLGQSFGGFCVVTYLSTFPGSLREAFVTGGLPPLDRPIDEVYAATYRTTASKNEQYYARYPDDRSRVRDLVTRLAAEDVRLPDGDRLTPGRFRQLGLGLGMGDGAEALHHLLELDADSPAFRHDVAAASPFPRNPLYAVIHESCYAPDQRTSWSASRVQPQGFADDPTLFTGEHMFPWMFDDIGGLVPFRDAAVLLADHAWGPLYDAGVLAANEVPCAAAVYADDMYVDRELSLETAAAIKGMRVWLTNEFEHDGLRAGAGRVLDRLIALARGRD
jgi:pimeloyl-ACP methyl ester carboxylesterase